MPNDPAGQPPSKLPRRFYSRRIFWLILLILLGPWAVMQVPLEVGRWKLAAAVQARADGHNEQAYSKLAEAMRWIPSSPMLLFQQAAWRLADGDKAAALADAEKLLEISGESAGGLMLHSDLMQKMGRHAEAIADWKKIDQFSQRSGIPSRSESLNSLAYFQAVANTDLDAALAHANEALELNDPNDDEHPNYLILDTRGYLRYLKGHYQGALEDLNLAITGMNEHLQKLREKNGVGKVVSAKHLRLLDSRPDVGSGASSRAVTYYHRALIQKALGHDREAEADLAIVRRLIGREPDETLY